MAIASPSAPSFSASFCCTRTEPTRFVPFSTVRSYRTRPPTRRVVISSRLNSSTRSNGSVSPDNGDLQYELQHGVSTHHQRKGSPVFVTLPLDAVDSSVQMRRRKTMSASFRALAAAGVEGVVMEVWWGLVERDVPRAYNWQGYLDIVSLAQCCGLKVRAAMAFHQGGVGPEHPFWIPLPQWVLEEIDKDPDLAYSDRFGRRNREYISLGCDVLPVLQGRSPIQVYADFMRNFRDTFEPFLGDVITGVQIGMGPAGELRYPSCPSQKLTWDWRFHELGEFMCYDKYMLASLNACAEEIGKPEWGNWGPHGTGSLMQNPENTDFFKDIGSWNTPYGEFFLKWYSGLLLSHGERICREAEAVFLGTKVKPFAKLAAIYWHYRTRSHPSELTAGYYNTSKRNGYVSIARMFGQYGFTLCCPCFEMKDSLFESEMNPSRSPEGFLRQILLAAKISEIPLEGENSATSLDDDSFKQVIKMSGLSVSFSFNFVRMDKNFFSDRNFARFTRFVRLMSEYNVLRAKLNFGGGDMFVSFLPAATATGNVGVVLAC